MDTSGYIPTSSDRLLPPTKGKNARLDEAQNYRVRSLVPFFEPSNANIRKMAAWATIALLLWTAWRSGELSL